MSGQAPPPAIHFARDVAVAHGPVRLGDVADLSALPAPLRRRAGALVVAAPGGTSTAVYRVETLRSRARALMPALAEWLPRATDTSTVRLSFSRPAAPSVAGACAMAVAYVPPGGAVTADDLRDEPCPSADLRHLRYSVNGGSAYAPSALSPGDIVALPGAGVLARTASGQRITLVARAGVVTVERQVETVQPLVPGKGVFVRADDGGVFAAPAAEIGQ